MVEQLRPRLRPSTEDPTINIGIGGRTGNTGPSQRGPSLGQRAFRGDFRVARPSPAGDAPQINTGMDGLRRTPALRAPGLTGGVSSSPATAPTSIMRPSGPALAGSSSLAPTRDFSRVTGAVAGPVLRPGDLNTFTGRDGQTRRVTPAAAAETPAANPPGASALQPVTAAPTNAPQVRESIAHAQGGQRRATLQARSDVGAFLNPMSQGGEIMRRARSAASTMRGSPSARAATVNALLGQLGVENQATASGQHAQLQTLQQGPELEAAANEGAAQRQLSAAQGNADTTLRQAVLRADQQRPTGQSVRGLDGSTNVLRNDGTAFTLRDEAGNPIRTPDPAAARLVSADAEFKSLTDLLKSYEETPAPRGVEDERAAEVAGLRQRMQQLTGQASQPGQRQVVRTGSFGGRRVAEYSDGSVDFLD